MAINVSSGPVDLSRMTRFQVEQELKNVVQDLETRAELARRLWEGRGGTGLTKAEAKEAVESMVREGLITRAQAGYYLSDLGVY